MQMRTRFLIHSIAYDAWLNRMADGITDNMFNALWFHTEAQAEEWMNGMYAPKDKENYEIQQTLTTMEVVENERDKEFVSENQSSDAGHSVFAER